MATPSAKKAKESGFSITEHKGFRMTFENGWSISVQWGPGNYTSKRDTPEGNDWEAPAKARFWSAPNAEIAIFDDKGNFHRPEGEKWGDDVAGWQTPDQVLFYMNYAAAKRGGA